MRYFCILWKHLCCFCNLRQTDGTKDWKWSSCKRIAIDAAAILVKWQFWQQFHRKKQLPEVFYKKLFLQISQYSQKKICEVADLRNCNFTKKRHQHRCYPVNFTKILRTPILKNICERVLLHLIFPSMLIRQGISHGLISLKFTVSKVPVEHPTGSIWKRYIEAPILIN